MQSFFRICARKRINLKRTHTFLDFWRFSLSYRPRLLIFWSWNGRRLFCSSLEICTKNYRTLRTCQNVCALCWLQKVKVNTAQQWHKHSWRLRKEFDIYCKYNTSVAPPPFRKVPLSYIWLWHIRYVVTCLYFLLK